MMAYSKYVSYLVDAILIASIIWSGIYLARNSGEPREADEDSAEETVFGGAPPLTQPQRDCDPNFVTTIPVVVSLSFSGQMRLIDPSEMESIGNALLDKLLEQCYCNVSQDCLQWTLTIDEFDFSRSDYSTCPTPRACTIDNVHPISSDGDRTDTTTAKVFLLGQNGPTDPECIFCTVQKVLEQAAKTLNLPPQ
ncbi:hypothetical protein GBAR_LOCUS12282 [Geodia barretti]|uniref:Uncharacterized protein n=1 Tax=Geodia barretti TaxID=519541 RepID=A0AA35WH95_GEOBA|nr:hypothetical protein GBAR_LOCUS12282 [Geodia barretti]